MKLVGKLLGFGGNYIDRQMYKKNHFISDNNDNINDINIHDKLRVMTTLSENIFKLSQTQKIWDENRCHKCYAKRDGRPAGHARADCIVRLPSVAINFKKVLQI